MTKKELARLAITRSLWATSTGIKKIKGGTFGYFSQNSSRNRKVLPLLYHDVLCTALDIRPTNIYMFDSSKSEREKLVKRETTTKPICFCATFPCGFELGITVRTQPWASLRVLKSTEEPGGQFLSNFQKIWILSQTEKFVMLSVMIQAGLNEVISHIFIHLLLKQIVPLWSNMKSLNFISKIR